MKVRVRHAAAAAAVVALLATACGSEEPDTPASPSPTDSPTATSTPTEDDTPVAGGTLVVGISSGTDTLNPAHTTSGSVHTASELMYNGLVALNADTLEAEGDLAESWDITDDGATYTFTLRDGIQWHDGTPFTSADVKYTFEEVYLGEPPTQSRTNSALSGALESVETPDDQTVIFRFNAPYGPFLQQLNVTEAPIIAKHIYEGTDRATNPANQAPVGTGPFQFVSFEPDQELRLAKNENYFKEGLPYFDEVVMRIIPDDQNQVLALQEGEVDWLWGVPGALRDQIIGNPDFVTRSAGLGPGGGNCINTISFNLFAKGDTAAQLDDAGNPAGTPVPHPILSDVRVRRAFALALDKQVFLDRVEFGEGRVAVAPIHSDSTVGHVSGLDIPTFDPDAAEALLDEAGWVRDGDDGTRVASGVDGVDDGTPLVLSFLVQSGQGDYTDILKQQLADVGIELDTDGGIVAPEVFRPQVFTDRDFDTNLISYCNGPEPQIGVRRMYVSSNIKASNFSNSSGYINADVDRLFDEARATVDLDARQDLYRQISEILVEELPYFWLVETSNTRVWSARCDGFKPFELFAETAFCRES